MAQDVLKDWLRMRYVVAVMAATGMMMEYGLRFNISTAILAMAGSMNSSTTSSLECPIRDNLYNDTTANKKSGEFHWDSATQGMVLSSFFYGYILTQLPGGRLAERLDAKLVAFLAIFFSSIFTLLTPVVARWNVGALIALRACMGFVQGPSYPTFCCVISRWSPQQERTTLMALVIGGSALNNVVTPVLVAYLSDHGFANGWPSVFYVYGIAGCTWCILWLVTVSNFPEEHRWIVDHEVEYIQVNRDTTVKGRERCIPWRSMVTSVPLYALLVVWFALNWGYFMLLSDLPSYLHTPLNIPMQMNGTLNAITNVISVAAPILAALLADFLVRRKSIRISTIRKVFTVLGCGVSGVCLAMVPLAKCDFVAVTFLLTVAVTILNVGFGGANTAAIEIAPDFSGTIMGLINTLGTLSGVLAPLIIGYINNPVGTLATWSIGFYLAAGICLVASLFFAVYGTAEPQPWAITSDEAT